MVVRSAEFQIDRLRAFLIAVCLLFSFAAFSSAKTPECLNSSDNDAATLEMSAGVEAFKGRLPR